MGQRTEYLTDNFEHSASFPPLDAARNRRDMVVHFDSFLNQQRNPDGTVGQLTGYQTEALVAGRDFIASADESELSQGLRGRFDLACAFGKTALELYTARGVGAGKIQHNGSRRQVLLNTSRLSIVKQMTESNIQYECDEGLTSDLEYFAPELRHSVYSGKRKDISGDIVIMPYNSYKYATHVGDVYPDTFPLCLLDENHNLGRSRSNALFHTATRAVIMGFSATPGNTKWTLPNQIAEVSMLDGIMKYGFLSSVKMYATITGRIIRKERKDGHDYSSSDMSHLSHDFDRNQQIVDVISDSAQKYGRGIVRCHPEYKGFNHAYELLDMIEGQELSISRDGIVRPLRAEVIFGKSKKRREIMDEFRSTTNIDALLSVSYMAEGVNVPGIGWGLWTPPTRSYDLLTQFMGRGNRRDARNPGKVFHFSQLVDIDIGKDDGNVFGWEIIGAPRNAKDVSITRYSRKWTTHPSHNARADGLSDLSEEDGAIIIDRVTRMVMSADMLCPPLPEETIDVATLESTSGIGQLWLRRILQNAGYSAYIRPDDDDFVLCYEKDAGDFIADSIARIDDVLVRAAREEFGMDHVSFMKMLDDYGLETADLYIRQPGANYKMIRGYLRGKTYRELKEYKVTREHQEMPLHKAAEETGMKVYGSTLVKYFSDRNFKITKTRTVVEGREVWMGERDHLMDWIEAYQNAVPAPDDYRTLKGYSKQQFADGKPTYQDFFTAAERCGIKVKMFLNKGGNRQDYVKRSAHDKFCAAISEILQQKEQQKQKEVVTKTPEDMPDIRRDLRQRHGIWSIVLDEPQLWAAITGQEPKRTAVASQTEAVVHSPIDIQQRAHTHDRPLAEVPRELIGPLRRIADNYYQSPRLLKLLLQRHDNLKQYNLRTQSDIATKHLIDVLAAYGRVLPRVPETWIYSGDLASQLQISHFKLIELLVAKRINSNHAALIKMPGIQGMFAFCSPRLATALLGSSDRPND